MTAAKTNLPHAEVLAGAAAVGDGPPSDPREPDAGYVAVSHEALFVAESPSACDACGGSLDAAEPVEEYRVPGRGVYLSARGGETHFESVPLCSSCASAIGMTALARWEIEEEEG